MPNRRQRQNPFDSSGRLLDRRLVLGAGLGGLAAAIWPLLTPATVASPARAQAPAIDAAAAFAIDIDAGTELFALNPDQRLPTGSTVKLATALVVTSHAGLEETVVIDASDQVDITIYSHMGLFVGDTVSVQQLLYGLLLPSGSDAARALARHVGAKLAGDGVAAEPARAAFFTAMNELAAGLGAQNSRFVNASGDDDPNQFSSARDLAILATALLANPTLAEIVRTPAWESVSLGPEQRPFVLNNVNILLTEDPAVIGVKTGSTPDAGTCLVAARRIEEGNRVVTVVLGCRGRYEAGVLVEDGRWEATRSLVAAMTAEYRWISLAAPESLPGLSEELAVWQATVEPAIAHPVPAAAVSGLRYRLVLGPEGAPGAEVGRVMLYSGPEVIGERPVFQAGGPL
ncbi:MAG: serine hydrolase [Chloroflexota bacterium]|nr:serine hydrolase [Chloroflexota bacterium]